ncbi:MAG TPA: tyrosine-type recombinase/integrase [Candidatus Enterenecus stercoripullorum]|nr:tyrosine-type recombinase/integrase [Candidatus Enterenecus stercoripullorum]
MKCRKCHAEIPDDSKFCCQCGAEQNPARSRRTRGNGQGCAIKRGRTWTAVWTTEIYPDGEEKKIHQKRKWKGGFATKREALAYAAAPVEEVESPTLRNYWTGWSKSDMLDLSKSKQTAFNIAWNKLEPLAGKRMDAITINMLQDCIDDKAPTYYPAKDMKTLLSHLYTRAVAEGSARTNLAQFIRLPPLDEKELQPFTEIELHKLWDAYEKGDRIIGCVLLMIYTGMMPGELCQFEPDMVQWDKNEIVGCGLKTKKRKETPIVFPDLLAPVLQNLIETSNGRKYVVGMNRWTFYEEYHAALQRAGVRDLPPYSCRHTTATALALGNNVAPSVIQKVMRHTKFSTTQRYIHPDTADAVAAVNTLK